MDANIYIVLVYFVLFWFWLRQRVTTVQLHRWSEKNSSNYRSAWYQCGFNIFRGKIARWSVFGICQSNPHDRLREFTRHVHIIISWCYTITLLIPVHLPSHSFKFIKVEWEYDYFELFLINSGICLLNLRSTKSPYAAWMHIVDHIILVREVVT